MSSSTSQAPPLLPLVLASHPNPRVRERAATALGERMAAVPDRAPSSLPPTLLAIKALSRGISSANGNKTAAVQRKASARAALAALRAATAGAAHPLGAPVALRALSPLVQPIPDDSLTKNSKGDDSNSALKLGFTADAKAPDPKAHALALTLLADLWRHIPRGRNCSSAWAPSPSTWRPRVARPLIMGACSCHFSLRRAV